MCYFKIGTPEKNRERIRAALPVPDEIANAVRSIRAITDRARRNDKPSLT